MRKKTNLRRKKRWILKSRNQKKKKKKEELPFKICENHSRVLPKQEEYITYLEENRYTPILKSRKRGIIFLIDKTPNERESYLDDISHTEPHLVPPEPFEFDESAQLLNSA